METKREQVMKTLAERFATFSNYVTTQNKVGLYDINKSAERLFIDILNITYSFNLRDMNAIQDNYPAIDLGDYKSKVCFQVTSESSNAKFRNTVTKFKAQNLQRDFDKLYFLIISNTNKCSLTDKEINTVVINLNDLYKNICDLDDRDLFYIDNYLETNLVSRISNSDSILPSIIVPTYSVGQLTAFVNFLGLDDDLELKQALESDVKEFSQILSGLTKNQREFIYHVVSQGLFVRYGWGENIIMPVSEIMQTFGKYGSEIFEVIKSKNLAYINDDYDPHGDDRYMSVILLHFNNKLDDSNLFSYIKSFCGNNNNQLQQIFLNCDFSCLSG